MHKSVGAIIKNDKNEILMIERMKYPFGWACPAGHIEKDETPEQALKREILEETGLKVNNYKLLFHEFLSWNTCSRGVKGHDWYLYEILDWEGKIKRSKSEAKQIKWIAVNDFNKLKFEEAYSYWFKKLKII
ncbi:hypothetical protein DRH27_02170 [Candidatus Falkowbacteria bacterium]|nr:MAG: hypothetical protein DRH27_02170 [Candidatus Falkowbacteria bacterium]